MDAEVLHQLGYGLYVVSSRMDGRYNGQVANALMQVCAEPAAVAVCLNKKNLTHEYVRSSRVFTASVLSEETPLPFIARFGFRSGRDVNKFEGLDVMTGSTGAPILKDFCTAYLEAEVEREADAWTHTVFIGRVVRTGILAEGVPMSYAFYHDVKRGVIPRTAPNYVKHHKEESEVSKYECTMCDYIYDPAVGDPDSGVVPGTAFADLPDDWVCPVCGAAKSEFEKVED